MQKMLESARSREMRLEERLLYSEKALGPVTPGGFLCPDDGPPPYREDPQEEGS
jgi:hypothetical protein